MANTSRFLMGKFLVAWLVGTTVGALGGYAISRFLTGGGTKLEDIFAILTAIVGGIVGTVVGPLIMLMWQRGYSSPETPDVTNKPSELQEETGREVE